MPSGTTFNPSNIGQFEKSKLNFNALGVSGTLTAHTTSNLDLLMSDDCLITGAWLVVNGGNYGDYACLQVVDVSGAFSGTPNTVLNQFMTNWYLPPSTDTQFDLVYPAKIYAGLTIRVVYTSTGLITPPFVAVNYKLHKVLV